MRLLIAAAFVALMAMPAFAGHGGTSPAGRPACHSRKAIMQHLAKNYQERSIALGVANNGGVVELFIAKEGKTWTLIITLPSGPTCLLAAGKDWEKLPKVLYGKRS